MRDCWKFLIQLNMMFAMLAPPVIHAQSSAQPAVSGTTTRTAPPLGSDPNRVDPTKVPNFATASDSVAAEIPPALPPSAVASRYIYNSLRVVSDSNPRGCAYGGWDCMAQLCKADLKDQSAWRGWGGCWRDGNAYICYFECSQNRFAF